MSRLAFVTGVTVLLVALHLPGRSVMAAGERPSLAEAAMLNDSAGVRSLLAPGAAVDAAMGDGMTALHWAAVNGNTELVNSLLAAGASPHVRTRIGALTPLALAARNGHQPAIASLLRAGARPNDASDAGTTPLMLASARGDLPSVKLLLVRGADPNAKESAKGHSALMFAASANRAAVIDVLLEGGADPKATTKVFDLRQVEISADWTANNNASTKARIEEDLAARGGRPAVPGAERAYELHELVAAQGGFTPLIFAARSGHRESVDALLAAKVDINQPSAGVNVTPLLVAIINGHFELASHLLDRGANPNLAEENGVTPLYAVLNCQYSPNGEYPQPQAHLQGNLTHVQLIKKLLDNGADPNARLNKKVWYSGHHRDNSGVDEVGATPLWRAAYSLDVEAMRVLLAGGADPNLTTMANRAQRGSPTILALPLGGPGKSLLHAAAGAGYLQAYAGNGHHFVPGNWLPAVKFVVEELGADVNARDDEGNTALHYAAARGDNEMILYLVSKGGDVKVVNRRGQTTVDAANGPRQRVRPIPETIELLEGMGATNNHRCVSC